MRRLKRVQFFAPRCICCVNSVYSPCRLSDSRTVWRQLTKCWLQLTLLTSHGRVTAKLLLIDNITRKSSVAEIGERYRLNHAVIVQAACQAVVCVCYACLRMVCLQAACKLLTNRTHFKWRHSAIYSTLTNSAIDLLGVQGYSKLHWCVGRV